MAEAELSRSEYAKTLGSCCFSHLRADFQRWGIAVAVITLAVAGVIGYLGANDVPWVAVATEWPWNWDKKPGGANIMSGIGESLIAIAVVAAALVIWNVVCAPYRLARQASAPPPVEAPSDMRDIVVGALGVSSEREIAITVKRGDRGAEEWNIQAQPSEVSPLIIPKQMRPPRTPQRPTEDSEVSPGKTLWSPPSP